MIAARDIVSEADTIIVPPADIAPDTYAARLANHPLAKLDHIALVHYALHLEREADTAWSLARKAVCVAVGLGAVVLVAAFLWVAQ